MQQTTLDEVCQCFIKQPLQLCPIYKSAIKNNRAVQLKRKFWHGILCTEVQAEILLVHRSPTKVIIHEESYPICSITELEGTSKITLPPILYIKYYNILHERPLTPSWKSLMMRQQFSCNLRPWFRFSRTQLGRVADM